MFPNILLLESTFIQFYFSLCAFIKSFFEKDVKYLLCLTRDLVRNYFFCIDVIIINSYMHDINILELCITL